MFRGEPLAYWTIIIGFICYLMTQYIGMLLTGIIHPAIIIYPKIHQYIAILGWIGITIMGAQLQFHRAVTGLRRYKPNYFRLVFILGLFGGVTSILLSSMYNSSTLFLMGFVFYTVSVTIQFYWIFSLRKSKHYKFPLDYFFYSQIFLIIYLLWALFGIAKSYTSSDGELPYHLLIHSLPDNHVLTFGWISLTLQGAIIRILPMFVNKHINRESRYLLDHHLKFTVFSSIIFSSGYWLNYAAITIIGGLLWSISWIIVFHILIKSLVNTGKSTENKLTLLYFIPGLLWMTIGVFLGWYMWIFDLHQRYLLLIHIHLTLFAGLSLLMLGAIHRINAFQIYTLIYTGNRKEGVSLEYFLQKKKFFITGIGLNISPLIMISGFIVTDYNIVGIGGIMNFVFSIIFASGLVTNMVHYLKNKSNAIPFWLKANETISQNID
ncbi:MAG: hypothetical protein OEZ01_13475 [Candidatus Heimdallarchaeota archaeon]|nr:hypothetical protein [Candidatus Heimdallarchaeota archaeon]MDH5647018.1 hypothetical protein [Candidatus Heimdallarchaeota archaeon]